MATTNTAPAAGSNSVDMTAERMRSLLDRQRTAFLQEGAPAYETRIDRTNRLIALLVDNQDEIVCVLNADCYVFAAGNRCMLKPSELTPAT